MASACITTAITDRVLRGGMGHARASNRRSAPILTVLLLASTAGMAQQVPSAGGQLQQIPPVIAPREAIPELRVERAGPASPAINTGPDFVVSGISLTGETAFTEAQLRAVANFRPGASLNLGDLRAMAARITDFYNHHGYFVAQAFIPAQTLAGGNVTIAIVEGRYAKVAVRNTSHLATGVATRVVEGVDRGDPVTNAPLERRLLLLSDLPGTAVKSTLMPGTEVGTSDLLIDVRPAARVTGSLEGDDAGNRYTGYYRVGGALNLNEPFGIGDVASIRGLVSDGGLTYVRGSYQATLRNLTLGVAFARLDYRLHREFASLDAHGTADIASVYASYPLIRSYDRDLNALAGVDYKIFHDEVDSVGATSDKHSTVGYVGLAGDGRDHFGGGGAIAYSVTVSAGDLDIRTPAVRAVDDLASRSGGGFAKVSLAASRTQAISGPLSLYVAARGQVASKNLDISEKMELGGAYGVRAYPEGEAYGDDGFIATVEARLALAALSRRVRSDVQLFAFVDDGGVTYDHDRYRAGRNGTNLSAAGIGASLSRPGNFLIKASYAHRLGDTRVLSQPDNTGQFWLQLTKLF